MFLFLKTTWLPFLALLGVALAIAVPLFLGIHTGNPSSGRDTGYAVALAVLAATGISAAIIPLFYFITKTVPWLMKLVIAWIITKGVARAIAAQTIAVEWTAITQIGDDIGVGLAIGSADGVSPGHQFIVLNTADQAAWGVLQASEVHAGHCVCSVFDRVRPEFWDDLERRMRSDPSPPSGVIIRREIPGEDLLHWLDILMRTWRD